MNWISVNDRLPECYEKVLLAFINFDGTISTECGFWDGYSKFNIFGYTVTFDKCRITHWMPLPKPPEVEE